MLGRIVFVLLVGQARLRTAAGQSALFTNGTKFLALQQSTANPDDANGAVGRNHYVQVVNLNFFQVFDKSGFPVFPTQSRTVGPYPASGDLRSFFGAGTSCATASGADPIILYDKWADRWLMGFVTRAPVPPNPRPRFCLVVSNTEDPTGAYTGFEFTVSHTVCNSEVIA